MGHLEALLVEGQVLRLVQVAIIAQTRSIDRHSFLPPHHLEVAIQSSPFQTILREDVAEGFVGPRQQRTRVSYFGRSQTLQHLH